MYGGALSAEEKARAKAGEVITLANGAQGTYVNGKWRIVKGANGDYMNQIRASRGTKKLSPEAAQRAFNRYYKQRDYKTEGSRKAAITRDMHFSPNSAARITDTTRYLRNPGKLDYPGLDAGERKSKNSPNATYLEEYWEKVRNGEIERPKRRSGKMVRRSIKRKSKQQSGGRRQQQQQQQGGRAVSLKTAVKLLRSYYSQRYGRQ